MQFMIKKFTSSRLEQSRVHDKCPASLRTLERHSYDAEFSNAIELHAVLCNAIIAHKSSTIPAAFPVARAQVSAKVRRKSRLINCIKSRMLSDSSELQHFALPF